MFSRDRFIFFGVVILEVWFWILDFDGFCGLDFADLAKNKRNNQKGKKT